MIKGSMGGMSRHNCKNVSKSQKERIIRKKSLESQQEYLIAMRRCLFNDNGVEKNLLNEFRALASYKKGCNVEIRFYTAKTIPRPYIRKLVQLKRNNIPKDIQSEITASEFTSESTRVLLAFDMSKRDGNDENNAKSANSDMNDIIGFCHFQVSVSGDILGKMFGQPSVIIYDIHITNDTKQSKPSIPNSEQKSDDSDKCSGNDIKYGLAKHLIQLCELIARKYRLSGIFVGLDREQLDSDTIMDRIFSENGSMKGYSSDDKYICDTIDESGHIFSPEYLEMLPTFYHAKFF